MQQPELNVVPLLPEGEVVRTQYKLMARITTTAAGVIKGNSSVKGYEQWVQAVDFKTSTVRNFDAQDQLIGVPDAKFFRLTTLWDGGGIVPLTQSIFTGEDVTTCDIHCLRSGPQGEVQPAVLITLSQAKVLEVDYIYSHVAGPLVVVDLHPVSFKIVDNLNRYEFSWNLSRLSREA